MTREELITKPYILIFDLMDYYDIGQKAAGECMHRIKKVSDTLGVRGKIIPADLIKYENTLMGKGA